MDFVCLYLLSQLDEELHKLTLVGLAAQLSPQVRHWQEVCWHSACSRAGMDVEEGVTATCSTGPASQNIATPSGSYFDALSKGEMAHHGGRMGHSVDEPWACRRPLQQVLPGLCLLPR